MVAAYTESPAEPREATIDDTTTTVGAARSAVRTSIWRTHSRTSTIDPLTFNDNRASIWSSRVVARTPSAAIAALAMQ